MTVMDSPHKSTDEMVREILTKQDKVNDACMELKKDFKDFRNDITTKVNNLDRKVSCHDVEIQNVKENVRRYRNGTTGCSSHESETEDDETEKSLIDIIKANQQEQNKLLEKYNDTQKYIIASIIGLVATICALVIKLAATIFVGG